MDFKQTLNLPDPDFTIPMKANLPTQEPAIQARWNEQEIYHRIQEARKDAPTYVLHDGPPYTNGPIHLGTALNKIVKDFVLKSRNLLGYRVPYVPGYDNHGLPIEQAVAKKFAAKKETPDVVTFRQACRAHAGQFIGQQTEQFKRLGIFGLWEKPYTTMDFRFEAAIVRVFKRLVEKDYVYRGLRPTLWSPTSQTALADTEIVYHEGHESTSIYVRFPLKSDPNRMFEKFPNLFTVIWTTTPWTIPANLAVAFHPQLEYAIVKVGDAHYLLLNDLVEKTAAKCGWDKYELVHVLDGINFDHAVFAHPVFGRDSIAVMADYVTTEDGTGVVHTAPGHGRDDFYTGAKYGLPVLCPVNERGVLTEEAGEFAGVFYKKCDEVVVNRLRELGHLLFTEPYIHSYPYAERDDQPVIFRATEQWFVSLDAHHLREHMLQALDGIQFVPESGRTRLAAMLGGRPDWCVSRQRPWGVGIPVFYGVPSGQPVLDPAAMEAVARLVETEGSDAWFAKDAKDILPAGYTHPDTGETEFRKETDVLDVWFDSGSTSLAVLEGDVYPEWKEKMPADLYLEGSDQHRGWFNSSMIISMATRGHAPYKAVITHGMVNDATGEKMSKRLGNILEPVAMCEKFGADIVRYWACRVDWHNDMPCSEELLKSFGEEYRTVRNTLRFLLANLYDFDGTAPSTLLDLDTWIIEQTDLLVADCARAYEEYRFDEVMSAVHNFCAKELSKVYLDAIKDRMYCDGKDWDSRRSGQRACHYALVQLVKLIVPILPHTAEEVYGRIPQYSQLESVHIEVLSVPTRERLEEIEGNALQSRVSHALGERADCFAAFETWKATAETKDSQDVIVTVRNRADQIDLLKTYGEAELATLWKFSGVELEVGDEGFSFRASDFARCERSRLRRADVEEVNGHLLTARDRRAIGW